MTARTQGVGCSRELPCVLDRNRYYSRRPCRRVPRLPESRLDRGCRRGSSSSFPGLRRSTLVDSGSSWGSITRGWRFGAPKLRAAGYIGRLAQLVRAPSSHGGGHWFESSVAHSYLFAGARNILQNAVFPGVFCILRICLRRLANPYRCTFRCAFGVIANRRLKVLLGESSRNRRRFLSTPSPRLIW